MKIGLIPVNVGVSSVDQMVGLAKLAEGCGFESVWTFEHAIIPDDYASKYPYSGDGKMPVGPDTNFVDPLIALSAVAVATERVKLGTGVNILSQANPLMVAKQSASLDFVSGGRFLLGVGIGWLREEFEAMGTPFERRGARFDDYVQAMREVWKGEIVDYQSDFVSWKGFRSHPTPTNLPIVIGGTKGKAFERTAKYGDGYFAPNAGPEQMKELMDELTAACEAIGRDPATVEVTAMWAGLAEGAESIQRYREIGVSRLVVPLPAMGANPVEGVQKLGEEVIAKL